MEQLVYRVLFAPLAVQLVFLVLKWTGLVSWSWWWVMSPLGVQVVFIGLFVWMVDSMYSGPQ